MKSLAKNDLRRDILSHEKTMKTEMRGPDPLSIHRSFIIRLYPGADFDAGEISGWVEHVVSGEAGEFHSVEELLRFIAQLLGREDSRSVT